jgi:ribosome-binding factor A
VTPDLSDARIYVSVMAQPVQQQEALRALNAAASFFHRELKSRIQMRRIPFLVFRLEPRSRKRLHLAHIDEVVREEKPPAPNA